MKLWLDAQLSPALAPWVATSFGCEVAAVRDLGLRDAADAEIFAAARKVAAVVMTKDADFAGLVERFGPPPQVIWLTCGNTSNERLRALLQQAFPAAIALLKSGEALVEITGRE